MLDLVRSLSSTPVPICLIVLGVIFLFLAIGGKLGAQIMTDSVKKPVAAWLGCSLLVIGILLYAIPFLTNNRSAARKETKLAGKAYQLRDKSEALGPKIKRTQVTRLSNATLIIKSGNKVAKGDFDMTSTSVVVSEVLRKVNGHPVTVREQILSETEVTDTRIFGKTSRTTKVGPLSGQTVLIEWNDGKWEKNLVGSQPTPAQREELRRTYAGDQDLFPDQPKQVGESWELGGAQMALFGGLGTARSVEGHAFLRLEEVKEHARQQCALISSRGELQATVNLNGNDVKIAMGGYGSYLRSLQKFYTIKGQFSGEMRIEGELIEKDNAASITITGPFNVEVLQEEM